MSAANVLEQPVAKLLALVAEPECPEERDAAWDEIVRRAEEAQRWQDFHAEVWRRLSPAVRSIYMREYRAVERGEGPLT